MAVKVKADPPLTKVAKPFRKDYGPLIDKWLGKLAEKIHENIVIQAPYRTGKLRKAIKKRKKGKSHEIFVDRRMKGGKYEPFVRLGVDPSQINPILPRKKKALYWPGAAHPVKAVYNHPGIKANPYWERGLSRSKKDINNAETKITNMIERELSK